MLYTRLQMAQNIILMLLYYASIKQVKPWLYAQRGIFNFKNEAKRTVLISEF